MVKGKIWFDFCPGYPGQPEIESSHYTEQSPGYGHPYLPGDLKTMKHKVYKHMHVHLQTPILMLTTSCGPGILPQTRCPSMSSVRSPWRQGMGSVLLPRRSTPASLSSDPPVSWSQSEPSIILYQTSKQFNVRDGTVYTTVIQPTPVFVPFGTSTTLAYPGDQEGSGAYVPGAFPTFDPPASHSQPHPYYESDRSDGQGYPYINGYYDMPEPQFLIRTVLKNDTDLLKRSVDLQAFKVLMEDRLTRTYRQAYHQEYIPARNRRDVFYTGDYLNEYFHDSIQSCITCCRFHQACSPWEGDQSHA